MLKKNWNRARTLRRAVSNVAPVRLFDRRSRGYQCETLEPRTLLSSTLPIINEFMAKNQGGLADIAGGHPDWIELYNPGTSSVNLASWTLTDKDVNGVTTVFTFPTTNAAVTTIAAGGYKILFCDGSTTPIQSTTEIHTNFKMDKSGGSLILTEPGSPPVVTSSYDPYPQQVTNVSYGLGPQITSSSTLISTPSSTSVKVPTDASLGTNWTQNGFTPDGTWTSGTTGVGFENLGTSSNPPALPSELEPDESPAQADNATTNFVSQGSSGIVYQMGLQGSMQSSSDVDYYNLGSFQVGDVISLSASGSSSSEGNITNPQLKLYASSNLTTPVATDSTGSGPGNDALIDRFSIASADTYYVAVSEASVQSGKPTYNLGVYMENKSGTAAPTTGTSITTETELGNTAGTADDLSAHWQQANYLSQTAGLTSNSGTVDYYRFQFTAGDIVTFAEHSTGSERMKATLYNSSGTTIIANDVSSTSDVRASGFTNDAGFYSYVIPTTGNYYIEATCTAAGSYTLNAYLSTLTAPPVPGNNSSAIYSSLINTNIGTAMQNVNASAYVLVPFTVSDTTQISSLLLNMEYEDGFVAYINGTEVARSNAGSMQLAFNATAASSRTDTLATAFQPFDITAFANALVVGNNVLAIQGLNDSASDGRFLISPQLSLTKIISPAQVEYFTTATPGAANVAGALGTVPNPKLNKDDGFYEAPFSLTLSDSMSGSSIRYTTDGTVPTATTGTLYTGPITVSGTTVFRTVSFDPGYIPSSAITSSFLFLNTVQYQTTLNQMLSIGGGATGGTFTLSFGGSTTSAISYSSSLTAATVQSNLNGLTSIGSGGVSVTGLNGGPYVISFVGKFGNPAPITTGGAGSLTGGTPTITVTTNTSFPTSRYPATWAGDQQDGGGGPTSGTYPADYSINPALANPSGKSWTNADFLAGLTQIPTISVVTDPADLFATPTYDGNGNAIAGGIYQLPQEEGDAWQEPASVEMIGTDGKQVFEDDIGLRTQGAAARQNSKQPKHSFRILFDSEYGASSLDYPLFGPGSEGLDTIDFRATYNNSWTHGGTSSTDAQRNEADYLRDGWNRVTQHNMGDLGLPHFEVQLYLNGLYWGIYDATDRAESSYLANQLGGVADNYEVLNAGTPVDSPAANPNEAANDWSTLNNEVNNLDPSTTAGYNQITQLVDPTNLADYIIQMMYAGNEDWDANHNWYTYRNATIPGDGFKFIAWDSERTLEGTGDNVTTVNNNGEPSHIFQRLMLNSEFKLLFADRVHKFLFDGGALTPTAGAALYQSMASQINEAIVDESARWGDYIENYRGQGTQIFTKDSWDVPQSNVDNENYIINTYFPARTTNVLNQFINNGWYPSIIAPEYSQFGGSVPSGYQLTISNTNGSGTIYYSTDGTDPRVAGGGVSTDPNVFSYNLAGPPVLTAGTEIEARILSGGAWSALTDATFFVGPPPALRVSEIMYHPADPPTTSGYGSSDFQYIELENTGTTPIALAGYTISAGVSYTFPTGFADLQPGGFVVVASNPTAFQALYGTSVELAGPFVGDLNQPTNQLIVASPFGQQVENFTYSGSWYSDTDGDGFSLVAVDPNATNAVLSTKDGWRESTSLNGEPGAADPGINDNAVIINELLSNSTDAGDSATGDWIELANTTAAPINVGNWYLSTDSNNRAMWQIPAGTMIPANGYLTLTQTANFGSALTLPDAGGDLYLTESDVAGDLEGYRDHESFGAAAPGVTHGTYLLSTGSYDFPQLSAATFGAANALPAVGPIVMNELMYNPAGAGDEYVELRNITNAAVPLYDPANPANTWQFTNGITYTFPQSSSMPANAYALVVPIDPATFRTKYNIPASVQIFGPYTGALSNSGESVTLSKPGTPVAGVAPYITEDHVNYGDSVPWPAAADGSGASLERLAGNLFGDDPINWTASTQNSGTPGIANFPTISGISPATGPLAGGTTVIITGTGFTNTSAVKFGTASAATFTVNSDTQITAVNPAGTGIVNVTVTTLALGTSPTNSADLFTYAAVAAPNLVGNPVINGDDPNGLIDALPGQRSMVEDVVYTFDAAVTIPNANSAFTVAGAGLHPGTAPSMLSAAAVPGTNNTQWAVTLTGLAPGALGSIANGEYTITINAAGVFAASNGSTQFSGGAGRADGFYRLYGDVVNGDRTVNAADNLKFKAAINGAYNPIFDSNADGTINASDNLKFKTDLSIGYSDDTGFVTTI